MNHLRLSNVELLWFFSLVLAVAMTLRLRSHITTNEMKRSPNNTTVHVDRKHGKVINSAGRDLHSGHNGHDGHPPGYPFFWFHKNDMTQMPTVFDSVNEELKSFAQLSVNSPSLVPSDDHIKNGVPNYADEDASLADQQGIQNIEIAPLRLRGGGSKRNPRSRPCRCGGACNHDEFQFDEDESFDEEDSEGEQDSFDGNSGIRFHESLDEDHTEKPRGWSCNHNPFAFEEDERSDEEIWKEDEPSVDSSTDNWANGSFDDDRRDVVDDFPSPECNEAGTHFKSALHLKPKKRCQEVYIKKNVNDKMNCANIEAEVKSISCCSNKCITSILSVSDVYNTRKYFLEKSREEQGNYLLDFFQTNKRCKGRRTMYDFYVEAKKVCQKAWIHSHGLSYGKYHHWRNQVEKRGITSSVHSRLGMTYKSQRRLEAEIWFEEFVESFANRMPDVKRRELPSCMTINQVYEMYREELAKKTPLKPTQFRRMWKENFKDVIIPKTNRFSKCGVCLLITEHIRSIKDKNAKMTWTSRKQLHMDQQAGERKKYYKHQKKAERNPEKYLSIIIDGMDQSKTHLPHWIQCSKLEGDNAHFLKTHVTGTISHGNGMALCFLDLMRWPQDANPTTNALLSTFRHIIRKTGSLPPVLYLQLDNCYRDCKNIHVLGFCALLVKAGVFKKVRLSYLIVGHTHEDIDQMFSRIAEALKRKDAVTLEQLRKIIHNSYTPSPVSVYRENIYDIKSWLRRYTTTLKHHSHPHAFRFKLNEKGQVEMTYRNWAVAKKKEWLPKEGPIVILEELPPGTPFLQRPDNLRCPSIDAMEVHLKQVSVRMDPAELAWWRDFIEAERERRRKWEEMTDEDFHQAGTSFDLFRMQYKQPSEEPENRNEAFEKREEELKVLIAKKNNFPPVQTTKKSNRGKEEGPGKKRRQTSNGRTLISKKKKSDTADQPTTFSN